MLRRHVRGEVGVLPKGWSPGFLCTQQDMFLLLSPFLLLPGSPPKAGVLGWLGFFFPCIFSECDIPFSPSQRLCLCRQGKAFLMRARVFCKS